MRTTWDPKASRSQAKFATPVAWQPIWGKGKCFCVSNFFISLFVTHWRFVRREKEISETKCELSQSESIRYQQRCEYLEGQIQDLQKNISEQRTQSEVDSQTAAQHAEVMEKVQKLNELTEANKILTSEKETTEETVREMVTKVYLLQFAVALRTKKLVWTMLERFLSESVAFTVTRKA